GRRGARPGRGGDRARRPRLDRGRRAAAHVTEGRVGDRRHGPGAGAGPQGVGRGDHRGRGRGRERGPRDRLRVHPGGHVLLPAGGVVRTDGEGGQGGRL